MERKIPRPGEIYDHFKDKPYQIITIAADSETGNPMVVYQALYGDFKTYVRPLSMFMSEVDHEKYPEVKHNYRFELREEPKAIIAGDTHIEQKSVTAEVQPTIMQTASQINQKVAEAVKLTQPVEEPVILHTPDGEVNLLLMKFLDSESYSKKLEVITSNRKHLDDRLITDMAVALDLAVDEGPLEQRIQGLINCLQAMRRFEDRRLR